MITSIKVMNRFHVGLIKNKLEKPPSDSFALISIYSTPEEVLFPSGSISILQPMGCYALLTLLFGDADPDRERVQYPFLKCQAEHIQRFLKEMHEKQKEMMLVVHCDAGISRSGAVATFASNLFDIPFKDEYIKPNTYVLRMLNNLIWEKKYEQSNYETI